MCKSLINLKEFCSCNGVLWLWLLLASDFWTSTLFLLPAPLLQNSKHRLPIVLTLKTGGWSPRSHWSPSSTTTLLTVLGKSLALSLPVCNMGGRWTGRLWSFLPHLNSYNSYTAVWKNKFLRSFLWTWFVIYNAKTTTLIWKEVLQYFFERRFWKLHQMKRYVKRTKKDNWPKVNWRTAPPEIDWAHRADRPTSSLMRGPCVRPPPTFRSVPPPKTCAHLYGFWKYACRVLEWDEEIIHII